MTDNEIINKLNRAADEITNAGDVSNVRILADDFFAIYNLINRLKAENERLGKELIKQQLKTICFMRRQKKPNPKQ